MENTEKRRRNYVKGRAFTVPAIPTLQSKTPHPSIGGEKRELLMEGVGVKLQGNLRSSGKRKGKGVPE